LERAVYEKLSAIEVAIFTIGIFVVSILMFADYVFHKVKRQSFRETAHRSVRQVRRIGFTARWSDFGDPKD
jgi:hypothetical protein